MDKKIPLAGKNLRKKEQNHQILKPGKPLNASPKAIFYSSLFYNLGYSLAKTYIK